MRPRPREGQSAQRLKDSAAYAEHQRVDAQSGTQPPPAAPAVDANAAVAGSAPAGSLHVGQVAAFGERVRAGIRQSMLIAPDRLEIVLCTLLAGGHLLIEDQPGVGKTQLARSISGSLAARFARVQATVDLLPTDLLGATVWNAGAQRFEFHPGPVFTNVLLVDELNRATPKTQSGLLEVMQELQVTMDGATHRIDPPFMVIATQNPTAGFDGTYPLPPAQLDRFLSRISLGYPDRQAEAELLRSRPEVGAAPVATLDELVQAQQAVNLVGTADPLLEYIVGLLDQTRRHPLSEVGASPRAGLGLLAAARARAALQGRDYALPDDVQALAQAVLCHRIQPVAAAPADAQEQIVRDALGQVYAR